MAARVDFNGDVRSDILWRHDKWSVDQLAGGIERPLYREFRKFGEQRIWRLAGCRPSTRPQRRLAQRHLVASRQRADHRLVGHSNQGSFAENFCHFGEQRFDVAWRVVRHRRFQRRYAQRHPVAPRQWIDHRLAGNCQRRGFAQNFANLREQHIGRLAVRGHWRFSTWRYAQRHLMAP